MSIKATACVLATKESFEVHQYSVPEPGPGGVLIKMDLCGICGTDLHYYHADLPATRYPLLLGHENVGTIAALGAGVETDFLGNPVRVGDRVVPTGGAPAGVPCGRCYFCAIAKTPSRCIGGKPVQNASVAPHFTGGYAQYLYLGVPGSPFFKTDLPIRTAVLLEPLTATIHAAQRAGIQLGDTVVVQGSGAMGLMEIICARMSGAVRIINVGGPATRLALAKKYGADATIDIFEIPDPAQRASLVRRDTPSGLGADVVFECAGVPAAINEGLGYLRDSGTLVEVGHFIDSGNKVTLNPAADLVRRNINVAAPFASSVEQYARGLRILEKGDYAFSDMVSHVIPLSEVENAIQAMDAGYRLDGADVIKICVAPNAA